MARTVSQKFTDSYVREMVTETVDRSVVDQLADVVHDGDEFVRFQLQWTPIQSGSFFGTTNGVVMLGDNRAGGLWCWSDENAGTIDYRNGEGTLKKRYADVFPLDCTYDYEPAS